MENKTEAQRVWSNMMAAANIMRNGVRDFFPSQAIPMDGGVHFTGSYWVTRVERREWHMNLQARFEFHPAVERMCQHYRPKDWQQLVLEWPHKSESDPSRLAYTRDERAGLEDRQLITTIGKYLTRHFPQVPDHEIRNAVAAFSVVGCKVVRTIAEMLDALARGPHSCMRWGDGADIDDDNHPYKCYDPRLGWGMAVRTEGGEVVGRALVYEADGLKQYVRTYKKPSDRSQYSQSDDYLNAWLTDQGYERALDWQGCKLAYYSGRSDRPLAPYLDGDCKDVNVATDRDGKRYLIVTEDGEFNFSNTDGSCNDNNGRECTDCGDRVDEGDGYWVGRAEEELVCQHCCDHNYYYVYGRRGNQYYLHSNQVVHVGDEAYDEDYLGDNDIVYLEDRQEYAHIDDAVYVESVGDYYDSDSDDVCYDDYNERYELRDYCVQLADGSMCNKDDAWQCEHSNDWYSTDVDSVTTPCGKIVHEDYAAEYAVDDEETTEETTGE